MRSVISKKNALDLQKIIKEVTGRKITLSEAFGLLGHLCGLLILLWSIGDRVDTKNLRNTRSLYGELCGYFRKTIQPHYPLLTH